MKSRSARQATSVPALLFVVSVVASNGHLAQPHPERGGARPGRCL